MGRCRALTQTREPQPGCAQAVGSALSCRNWSPLPWILRITSKPQTPNPKSLVDCRLTEVLSHMGDGVNISCIRRCISMIWAVPPPKPPTASTRAADDEQLIEGVVDTLLEAFDQARPLLGSAATFR